MFSGDGQRAWGVQLVIAGGCCVFAQTGCCTWNYVTHARSHPEPTLLLAGTCRRCCAAVGLTWLRSTSACWWTFKTAA